MRTCVRTLHPFFYAVLLRMISCIYVFWQLRTSSSVLRWASRNARACGSPAEYLP